MDSQLFVFFLMIYHRVAGVELLQCIERSLFLDPKVED